jgi:hypothetical protein
VIVTKWGGFKSEGVDCVRTDSTTVTVMMSSELLSFELLLSQWQHIIFITVGLTQLSKDLVVYLFGLGRQHGKQHSYQFIEKDKSP